MCGIFGFYINRPLTQSDLALGRKALSMMTHRGPDGEGEWYDANRGIYLGHRRLAIIDTSSLSRQPINIEGNTLSFNGELYNFIELRSKLEESGYHFRSEGDGEVLLQAWRYWGSAALDRFDGMFAFALHDGRHVNLVTDPFGEKPLYLLQRPEGIYFASEAQVLVDSFQLKFSPTASEVAAFMSLGFFPEGATGFRDLKALPPATHVRLVNGRIVDSRRYWSPPEAHAGRGKVQALSEQQVDRIHEDIFESLRLRLRSDVPVGIFLSGGVDSSLVAAMVSRELEKKVQTLTVAYPDGVDESIEAASLAEFLDLPHVIVDSSNDEGWRQAPDQLRRLYGIPNDNMTAVSVEQMSRLARKYMTVALSGIGGDEVFYGYNKYVFLYQNRNAYRWLAPLVKILVPFDSLLGRIPRWNSAAKMLRGSRDWQFLSLKNCGLGQLLREITGKRDWADGLLPGTGRELALRARDFDLGTTLHSSYIPAIDRGSMRASLEVRTPFLSRRLVETVGQMDQRSFLAFGQKEVLRKILARYVPRHLTDRPKRGFVFPANRYLSQKGLTLSDVPWIPRSVIERIWSNRMSNDYRGVAMRLAALSAFVNIGTNTD